MSAQSFYLVVNGEKRLLTDDARTAEVYAKDGCDVRAMTVNDRRTTA